MRSRVKQGFGSRASSVPMDETAEIIIAVAAFSDRDFRFQKILTLNWNSLES